MGICVGAGAARTHTYTGPLLEVEFFSGVIFCNLDNIAARWCVAYNEMV